ncbi:LacI family DNA-binding transcriptional regulator [Kribbella sp. NPDC051936]|uniref:LacI family DNA-binding transcriptional regulator n=1 Tax=Kribbella sp. NPDC051936 TaxID=3154946 RepID=UPI003426DF29
MSSEVKGARRGAKGHPKSGPSIGDVARLAGVSSQTVSRVSTGSEPVRAETRERVLDAMRQLGYAPNLAARALRQGNFRSIGLIAHQVIRTGESKTIEAVIEAARREGYSVSLVDVETPSSSDVSEAVQHLSHQAIDGLIIIRAETATPAALALPPTLPVAVSDSRFVGHHPAVGADQAGGSRAAVQHLLDLGHPTVHHIAGPSDSGPADLRATAWRQTLTSAGRQVPEAFVGDWSAEAGYRIGSSIAGRDDVTAVFAANDEMAAGLIHALHEAGRRVPDDVSVVGFDDIDLAAHLWPPLTTVRQEFHQIGHDLVEVIMRQLGGREQLTGYHGTVPAPLIVRQSTAAPRPRRRTRR